MASLPTKAAQHFILVRCEARTPRRSLSVRTLATTAPVASGRRGLASQARASTASMQSMQVDGDVLI